MNEREIINSLEDILGTGYPTNIFGINIRTQGAQTSTDNDYGCACLNAIKILNIKTDYFVVAPKIDKTTSHSVKQNGMIECKIKRAYPAPRITWQMQPYCMGLTDCWPKKNLWEKVPEETFTIISSNSSQDTTLVVPATSKQNYFFRCIAHNKAGQDQHIVRFIYSGQGG